MYYKLSDLTIDGKGSYGIAASAVEYDPNKYTYLRITDINDDGTINFDGLKSVDDENAGKYLLKENDIVFARTGASTGRTYFYQKKDGDFVFAGFLIKYSLDPNKVNPRFLKYYTHSKTYYDWVHSFDSGATRGNINAKTFGDMLVDLPERYVQDKIVSILSDLDDKIAVNKKICENLEAQAQALFKHWFVDFAPFKDGNFCANREQNETCFNSAEVQPKITGKACKFVESELGLIPERWRVERLGEMPITVTDYVANGSFASLKENVKLYEEVNYAYFIRNTDLKSQNFSVFVDEHSYKFLSKSKLEGGEIIISNVGDVGSVHLCPYLDKPMTLGNNIIMVKPYNDFYRNFLYILFRWNYGQKLIQSIKGGSAQPKFNKTDFKSLKIIVPEESVLKKFDEIVSPMFNYVGKNNQESSRLATLRDTLLPKLMSGQIKVNEIEKSL
ncbi:MAG: restriction endonuclease subunit S [Prevotella sp.]|nr:restriction endonuclease subunit S [Prevotella sp.]